MSMSLKRQVIVFLILLVCLLITQLFFTRTNQQTLIDSLSAYQIATKEEKLVRELERDVLDLQRHVLVFKDTGSQSAINRFNELIKKVNKSFLGLNTYLPQELTNNDTTAMLDAMRLHLQDYQENFASVIESRNARSLFFDEGVLKNIDLLIINADSLFDSSTINNEKLKNKFVIYLSGAENIAYRYLLSPSSSLKNEFDLSINTAMNLISKSLIVSVVKDKTLTNLDTIKSQFSQLTLSTQSYLFLVNVVMAGSANELLYLANDLSMITANYSNETNEVIDKNMIDAELKMNLYSVVGILITLFIGIFTANRILKPIIAITNVFEKLSHETNIRDIPGTNRKDEIGQLAKAAKVFNAKITQTRQLLLVAQELNDRQALLNQNLAEAKLQAEQANASKSIFLANMSHEIRTPMNAIIGLVDLSIQRESDLKIKEHLVKISYSSQILLNVINDILDFSKIEAGKLDIEDSYFSFASLFDNLLAVSSLKASEKNLNLHLYVEPDLPTNALGDPLRISQVVLNLLSNAIKFTRLGDVYMSFSMKAIDETSFFLVVKVKDTGIGMSSGQLDKVFSPFIQADGSTSRAFGGTGLGLSIVKQLVKLMEGEVSVTSVENEGSQFVCSFKLQHEASPHPLMNAENTFGKPIYYFKSKHESYISEDYLDRISSTLHHYHIDDLANIVETLTTEHLIILDIENGRQSRDIHHHIMTLVSKKINFSVVTNTQPEQLSSILKSQWNCPVISHPFSPTQFYLFANELYGSDTFFASYSSDTSRREGQMGVINTTRYKGHVLLVEDNNINQIVAGEMLHSFGLSFDVAEDGRQAVTKVKNSPYYDLILMDIQMPVLDGNGATEAIRKAGFEGIPIIGLSANAMKEDFRKAISSGMNEYLTKPIKRETLRIAIEKYLTKV